MEQILAQFALDGSVLYCGRFGSGHINETYLVLDSTGRQYILQKINASVFKNVPALMENITGVIGHLQKKGAGYRQALALVPTKGGEGYLQCEAGYFRVYEYVADCLALDRPETPADFAASGEAFGRFQSLLADYPAHLLHETIPDFSQHAGAVRRTEAGHC